MTDFINDARQRITDALHDRNFPAIAAIERAIAPVQIALRERGGESEFAGVTYQHDSSTDTLYVTADEAPEGTAGFTSTARIRLDFDVKDAPGGIRLTLIGER